MTAGEPAAEPARRPLRWAWLGRVGYQEAWDRQERLREQILAGDDDAERLLLLEHDPVITLGRSTKPGHVLVGDDELARRGVAKIVTSRGGDVTVHGPGQLVIYPVVRLTAGLVHHMQAVGGAIAAELVARGIGGAAWQRDPAGVWVGGAKIAACGLHIRRRVAIHGFALNVSAASVTMFDLIVPCGLAGATVTSIERETGEKCEAPEIAELAAALAARIAHALHREPVAIAS